MDEMTLVEKYNHELYHHGVKGQRWGFRRYQNPDGSLTPAGKKRYDKLKVELDALDRKPVRGQTFGEKRKAAKLQKERAERLAKARQARIDKQKAAEERAERLKNNQLDVKEMTSEEIQAKIDRINLENRLKELMTEPVKDVTPQKASRGKEFTNKFKDDVVDKLAKNVAADLVAQTAKAVGAYGLNKVLNATINKDGESAKDFVFTNNKKKDK